MTRHIPRIRARETAPDDSPRLHRGLLGAAIAAAGIGLAGPVGAAQANAICSGIGDGAEIEAVAFDHSLKLVYAEPDGSYLGDVETRIEQNGETVLEMHCAGPWVLADLPPGRYEVTARFEGQRKTLTVTVGDGASEQVVTF
ncbi:hypothetical protein LNKW23_45940 [Paralimibaculum aggregatum]|uniref:Carboxypeptidase regulatory-like domain-containing protein n=1 Tax=Paralimibaculum aggregatum TaxID=3036245 RepID=A0ABQ6LTG6_9RHOB|nr:hypothetical protein [Limibaculum sp. NKW23]GMG85374.1 hypothetical protein LNKW23_45940 [Limibaculum sp. NKW23]